MIRTEFQLESSAFRVFRHHNPNILPISSPLDNPKQELIPHRIEGFEHPHSHVDGANSISESDGETRHQESIIPTNIRTGQLLAVQRVPPVGESFRIGWVLSASDREEFDPGVFTTSKQCCNSKLP